MRNLGTVEMAELLIALAQDSEAWAQDCNNTSEEAKQARIIAAEIQEVLVKRKKLDGLPGDQLESLLRWQWRTWGHGL